MSNRLKIERAADFLVNLVKTKQLKSPSFEALAGELGQGLRDVLASRPDTPAQPVAAQVDFSGVTKDQMRAAFRDFGSRAFKNKLLTEFYDGDTVETIRRLLVQGIDE